MAFPAGPLPNSAQLSNTFAPVQSVAFTGGGSDLDLTAPTASWPGPCAHDVYITAAGNLIAQLAGDSAPQTYPVVVGQVLDGCFVLLKGTSTASGIVRRRIA